MIGSALILAMALTGQAVPGADGPALSGPPQGVPRRWVLTVSPRDGQPIQVWGWVLPNGRPGFDPAEYPQFAAGPKPEPKPEVKPEPKPEVKPSVVGQAPDPSHTSIPTGVSTEKLPLVAPGKAWYSGAPVVTDAQGDRHTPAPGKADVFLTVIGSQADCKSALARLERDPEYRVLAADMGDRLAVNSYRPENPLASNVGLPNGGRPDVVVQDSRGTEVGRFAVEPQPAQVIAAIRKADPSYKPGGGKSSTSLPEWMVIVGLLAGWAVFAGLNNRKAAPIG